MTEPERVEAFLRRSRRGRRWSGLRRAWGPRGWTRGGIVLLPATNAHDRRLWRGPGGAPPRPCTRRSRNVSAVCTRCNRNVDSPRVHPLAFLAVFMQCWRMGRRGFTALREDREKGGTMKMSTGICSSVAAPPVAALEESRAGSGLSCLAWTPWRSVPAGRRRRPGAGARVLRSVQADRRAPQS
jgi:hypothetical protein